MSEVIPRDSHVTDPAEVRRLTGQNLAVLQALREGPKSAKQLAAISLKYTSRISDLRAAGYDIAHDRLSSVYVLIASPSSAEERRPGHDSNVWNLS